MPRVLGVPAQKNVATSAILSLILWSRRRSSLTAAASHGLPTNMYRPSASAMPLNAAHGSDGA